MKKPSIVLVITLMFILLITSLIIKNLGHTSSYVEQSHKDIVHIQLFTGLKNIQDEFLQYFVQNQGNVAELLEQEPFNSDIILEHNTVSISVNTVLYENRYNINTLIDENPENYQDIETLFNDNNISGFYDFRDLVIEYNQEYGNIESFKQFNAIIQKFMELDSVNEIDSIKSSLGFIDLTDKEFVLMTIHVKRNDYWAKGQFLYNVTDNSMQGLNIVFN